MPPSLQLARASLPTLLLALALASCSQAGSESRSPGAAQACTEIGCLNGLHLTWAQGSWKPGAYTIEVTLDGTKVTCEGQLPLPACASGAGFHCSPGALVRLGESGCALPPEQHGLAGIDIETMPAHVRVAVRRGGDEVGAQELTPQYRESRPNGPDCEPVCRQASGTLNLPQ